MSGIAARAHWDGAPVDDASMARMLDAIAHRGPHGRRSWHSGSVAIGHVSLCADPGSPVGCQPLAADGVCLSFDGRLDNGRELCARLEDAGVSIRAKTDAALVAAAYRAWGDACVAKLLGDFAFVVWDERRRRLLCARDILGVRPLVYYADARQFIAGSEVQQLLNAGAFDAEPNEGLVAEHLCSRVTSRTETLFRNVFRLPPAHLLIVSADGLEIAPYYDPYPGEEIRYNTDREYAEQFFSILAEAIRCRVPAAGPMGAYLSGGLDSSSVVCLAEHLRRVGDIRDVPLVTLSMIGRTPAGDESRYVDAVVRRWTLRSHRIEPVPADPAIFVDQVKQYRDMPEYPNVSAVDDLAQRARDEGCRVLLTGLGGDDWLCANIYHCPELLALGRFGEFLEQLRFESDSNGGDTLAATCIRRGVWPLLPEGWRAFVRRARGRHGLPPHIGRELAQATSLADRMQPQRPHRRLCASRTQQELYDWFWRGELAYCNEADDRHHAALGVEARHPFHDRRVLEFALAIPERQRWRSTQSKFVLRRALGDLLPPEVSSRETKGDYSHTIADALKAAGGDSCFDRLEIARRGWVCGDVVRETYRRMRMRYEKGDEQYSADTFALWTVYGLELWLNHAFG